MLKRFLYLFSISILVISFAVLMAGCGSATPANSTPTGSLASSSTAITSIDAQSLMSTQCSRCHSIDRVTSKTKTAAEWKITVDRMIQHGASLTPDQEQALIDFLAKNY